MPLRRGAGRPEEGGSASAAFGAGRQNELGQRNDDYVHFIILMSTAPPPVLSWELFACLCCYEDGYYHARLPYLWYTVTSPHTRL